MIKKVDTKNLCPGVYVERFGSDWFHHPFLLNCKHIRNRREIERMLDWGLEYVYIDTDRGCDVEVEGAQLCSEPESDFVMDLGGVDEEGEPQFAHVGFQEEVAGARVVREKARNVIHQLLDDVRGGYGIDIGAASGLVADMDNSVTRNKDALLLLMRVRSKDEYTFMHSVSVGAMLIALCRTMGFDGETARVVGLGGLLHDVGKMSVPLDILNKPGALTDHEFSVIKGHVHSCREILEKMHHIPETAVVVACQHHERFDGSGYPGNLQGDEIDPAAQMASIVDVFDAITANRCYHQGMDQVAALRKIYGWRSSHFNEKLVQHFIRCVGIYPPGTVVRLASGRIGVALENTGMLLKPVVRVVYDTGRDWAINPTDINLAQEDPQNGDYIVGYESSRRWRIDPYKVLEVGNCRSMITTLSH